MATGGHFGCPKITFDSTSLAISYQYATSIFLGIFVTKWPLLAILYA